jgi:hypothetical protein
MSWVLSSSACEPINLIYAFFALNEMIALLLLKISKFKKKPPWQSKVASMANKIKLYTIPTIGALWS